MHFAAAVVALFTQGAYGLGNSIFAEPSCSGLPSSNLKACCPASCGKCGGSTCDSAPGGALQCCVELVLESSRSCGPRDTGPCILPIAIPPGKRRCDSGLQNDKPYEDCEDFCTAELAADGAAPSSCERCKCKACTVCLAPPPPPPPSPPPDFFGRTPMGEPDAQGCAFEVTLDRAWARGFAVEIRLNRWVPGQQVLVDYGAAPVSINRMWSSTVRQLAPTNAFIFTLGPHPDERGGACCLLFRFRSSHGTQLVLAP